MKLYFRLLLTLWWSFFALSATGCSHSSEPNDGNLTVSGKTYLRGSANPLLGVTVMCAGLSTVSGADGAYELVGVPEGKHALLAEQVDCLPYSDTITVTSDTKRYIYLTLKPPKTCRIWGYISNAVDGPIAGATVRMQQIVVTSDSSGRYELPPMLYHPDTLFVSRKGYLSRALAVTLDSSEKQVNVSLVARLAIVVRVTEDTYVDESNPAANFGSSSSLLLSWKLPSERIIYLKWEFPEILLDKRRILSEASLDLFLSSPDSTSTNQTYSVATAWSAASITYSSQPVRGVLLERSETMVWYLEALTTPSINKLIADWKAGRPFYGVLIRGGPWSQGGHATFNSIEAGVSGPRLVLVLEY